MSVLTEERVSEAPWDGDAGRFTDEQWERSCVLDRKSCGGDWASKSSKARCSLPIREPEGQISRAGVHDAAASINRVTGVHSRSMEAAKASLRSAYKELGEDAPDALRADPKKSSDSMGAERLLDRYHVIPGQPRHGQEGLLGGLPLEVRASGGGDDGIGLLNGHFAVFNRWTEISSFFEGRFLESIAPGAFTKTLQENKGLRCLFQHGRDPQIGMKPLGSIRKVEEDNRGALYEVPLFDADYVRELLPGLKSGQFGASFRFQVVHEEVNSDPGRSEHNPDGIEERTIKECRVREFGPVTFPAYEDATAGVRSIVDDSLREELGEAAFAGLVSRGQMYIDLLLERAAQGDETPETERSDPEPESPEPTPESEGATPSDKPDGPSNGRSRTTRLSGPAHTPLRTTQNEEPVWKL